MVKDFKKACAKELEKMVPHITAEDRQAAFDKKIVSKPTLQRYLQGDIVKIDLAMELITFFKRRIKARQRQLIMA